MSVLLVIAKAPVAGLAKTRLCPPATPRQAAAIAAAALLDTLQAVAAVPAIRPVLAYTGRFADAEAAPELRAALTGWHLVPQRGDGFGERLANAHSDTAADFPGQPVLQIGMDTPQVAPGLLDTALHRLGTADAVLGMAEDGGWWALGLRDPNHAGALRDVPMSTPDTGRLTKLALTDRGLRIGDLPVLSDVDTWQDARTVAEAAPGTNFARAVTGGLAAVPSAGGWDVAFADGAGMGGHWLVDSAGQVTRVPVHRWQGPPEPAVRAIVDRCAGPTVDIGCGPGRVAAEVAGRGLISLGIDISARAVRLARRRGATALHRDVFDPLPAEGRWSHVLLLDGNIGIGGDPAALLRRCSALLAPGGTVLVELDPPGAGTWQGSATILGSRHRGRSFRWARLGVEAVHQVAVQAQLTVRAVFQRDGRWFAELER
jgi:glycosyltransferase A (GT-A) superfamily protein (DUF2064 family)/SAM-dependent methyltransferase